MSARGISASGPLPYHLLLEALNRQQISCSSVILVWFGLFCFASRNAVLHLVLEVKPGVQQPLAQELGASRGCV